MIYAEERAPHTARPLETVSALERLGSFWGKMKASQILGPTCRAFVETRKSASGARRDLETLRAAVKHYKKEYGLEAEPLFWLPPKSMPRDRWLTREEAARLLWSCHRSQRRKHLVRFILIGLYTATRHDAILRLQWHPNTTGGWADLESGILYRRAPRARETKKRQPTSRIPDRLLAHMRRWKRLDNGIRAIVHYEGKPIGRLEKSFRAARTEAGLDDEVIPHALRHTAITWLMQSGIEINDVSKFAGVTTDELERTYWHHHPDFQGKIASVRMGGRKVNRDGT